MDTMRKLKTGRGKLVKHRQFSQTPSGGREEKGGDLRLPADSEGG